LNSTISMKWDNQTKTLTIGERKGTFAGMLTNRKFNFVLVQKDNGAGVTQGKTTRAIIYNGKSASIKF